MYLNCFLYHNFSVVDESSNISVDWKEISKKVIYLHNCDLILKRDTFPQNNFDQMLTLNWLSFHHLVQGVNEVWYPGRAIIKTLNFIDFLYKMAVLQAIKGKHLIKIILWESVPLRKIGHNYIYIYMHVIKEVCHAIRLKNRITH